MAAHILQTFSAKGLRDEAVFVSFITAGYPGRADTVPVMLALQQGGADIIELGIPFSDPQADGPAIQASNSVRSEAPASKALLRLIRGSLLACRRRSHKTSMCRRACRTCARRVRRA